MSKPAAPEACEFTETDDRPAWCMTHASRLCKPPAQPEGRDRRRRVGVAAIPNRCGSCGKFKRWEELTTHFVPDTAFSSEDESWRECDDCREKDRKFMEARKADFDKDMRDTSDAD